MNTIIIEANVGNRKARRARKSKRGPDAIILFLDGKGGVYKSGAAGVTISLLRFQLLLSVIIFDFDSTNSTTAAIFDDAVYCNLMSDKARGGFHDMLTYDVDVVVADIGARDEARVKDFLPAFMAEAQAQGTEVIVFRPITLANQVQANALDFAMRFQPMGVRIVFARCLIGGRTAIDYARRWDVLDDHLTAVEKGAQDVDFTDVGAIYGDNQMLVRRPWADIVQGNFGEIDAETREEVEEIFDRHARMHIGIWLRENMSAFHTAIKTWVDL